MRKYSIEEVLRYAELANEHARDQIRKGSTQLENNNLSETYFDFLREGIGEPRTSETGIRNIQDQDVATKISSNPLEKDPTVASYESVIEITSKYSIGNCNELAVQALDYILNNTHDLNAEVYRIHGGDHGFLVLNRDQDSNPQDPKTWGENAVICDPWANKVYKASDYLSELKNFYRRGKKNYIENFDPYRHLLVQLDNKLNTNFLRYMRSVANLKANFLDESKRVIKILESYKDSLKKEENRIREKYGDSDERALVILDKIKVIDASISSTKDFTNHLLKRKYKNDYRFAKSELMDGVGLLNKNAVVTMQFSKEDQSTLFEHKGQDKQTEIMKFFGIKSKAYSHIEDLTKNVNEQLSKKSK